MIDYINKDYFLHDGVDKQIIITYGEKNVTNESIYSEEFALTKSICSENALKFGGCESGMLEFKVKSSVNLTKGEVLDVSLVINHDYTNSFYIGQFTVESNKLTTDKNYRNIVAYDKMYSILNTDVAEWYNGMIFPLTLKSFRKSLFEKLEINCVETDLPNDMAVIKTPPYYDKLYAGDILKDICEINGCFGVINHENKFEFLSLGSTTTYEIDRNMYVNGNVQYEDFITDKIGSIILKQKNSDKIKKYIIDINPYTVETRALYFGEDETELSSICSKLYTKIGNIQYIPYSANAIGNYCVECGDKIKIEVTKIDEDNNVTTDTITSYVLERKITGIQHLEDEYTAQGEINYYYNNNYSSSSSGSVSGEIGSLQRNTLSTYTFTNATEYLISTSDKQIIRFNVSATADSDVVLVATIPLYMNTDGLAVLNYTVDGLAIENNVVKQYLHRGNNLITVTNYIPMGESSRFILGVNLALEYIESLDRQYSAKILSLENYVKNGTYTTPTIDTTLPTATINKNTVKAVLFAKGSGNKVEWDGIINVNDEYEPFINNFDIKFMSKTDNIDIGLLYPTLSGINDTFDYATIGNIKFVELSDNENYSQVIEAFVISYYKADNYTYNKSYVRATNGFCLIENYENKPIEQEIDSGSFKILEIITDDKSTVDDIQIESIDDNITLINRSKSGTSSFKVTTSGRYSFELKGAGGGRLSAYKNDTGTPDFNNSTGKVAYGGKGGLTQGYVNLVAGETVYAVVGGGGIWKNYDFGDKDNIVYAYNGGGANGSRDDLVLGHGYYLTTGGGGATHLALRQGLLSELADYKDDILAVAGGGSGANVPEATTNFTKDYNEGNDGGGEKGEGIGGGSQTTGYKFGQGADVCGGGWYGGERLTKTDTDMWYGTGGSGYIGNERLSNATTQTGGGNQYDGSATLKYDIKRRFLIKVGDSLYTYNSTAVTEINPTSTELNSELFLTYGATQLNLGRSNTNTVLKEFLLNAENPQILAWQDLGNYYSGVINSAYVTANPNPQTIIADKVDLTVENIRGIKQAIPNWTGTPVFACSFDDGVTWEKFNGTAWETAEENDGMTPSIISSITTEQWSTKIVGLDGFYVRFTLFKSNDVVKELRFKYLY